MESTEIIHNLRELCKLLPTTTKSHLIRYVHTFMRSIWVQNVIVIVVTTELMLRCIQRHFHNFPITPGVSNSAGIQNFYVRLFFLLTCSADAVPGSSMKFGTILFLLLIKPSKFIFICTFIFNHSYVQRPCQAFVIADVSTVS